MIDEFKPDVGTHLQFAYISFGEVLLKVHRTPQLTIMGVNQVQKTFVSPALQYLALHDCLMMDGSEGQEQCSYLLFSFLRKDPL